MKMTVLDLPLKAGRKYKVYGSYASTSAQRIKECFGNYRPSLRIAITNAITSSLPPPANACIFYVSEHGQVLNRDVDGTIYCGDTATIRFIDNATGQQHDIRLPKLSKRFVEYMQFEHLENRLAGERHE